MVSNVKLLPILSTITYIILTITYIINSLRDNIRTIAMKKPTKIAAKSKRGVIKTFIEDSRESYIQSVRQRGGRNIAKSASYFRRADRK